MSRYCGKAKVDAILSAAANWRDVALLGDGSVFTDRSLWTVENLETLDRFFVQNVDDGDGNYWGKLERQLQGAQAAAKQLAAELNWMMLLCPSNTHAPAKRQSIAAVWAWSGESMSNSAAPFLSDAVLAGVGSAGPGYNNHRWREFAFAIRFADAFKRLGNSDRRSILLDGWAFGEWLQSIPDSSARQLRHMLLFLLFPDDFERIFGRTDRRTIAQAFSGLSAQAINAQTPLELDRTLRRMRGELENKYGTKDLDYYEPPLAALWQSQNFASLTRDITVEHVIDAIAEIEKGGVPPGAESTGYDLLHNGRRYPPKLVLSLAAKAANGTEFDRSQFSGGEESPAFRLLRKLGFEVTPKSSLEELIRKFHRQADVGQDLAVAGYPISYRDLRVSVSFGKGTFARVPWVSFLAEGQLTQRGIYPLVLYYREAGWLVVAYGISETETPPTQWGGAAAGPTVKQHFEQSVGRVPERYGDSTVAAAFSAGKSLDLTAVASAIDRVIDQYKPLMTGVAEPTIARTETTEAYEPYTVDDAVEGLFVAREKFSRLIARLREKKNAILQGPPGVGKTFFARRVAYALIGRADRRRVAAVQFHAAYSYEDFVQGYRPSGTGFNLKNGIFFDFCRMAMGDPDHDYVFIIDEINRANLGKVFGELMMLIESDKRSEEWAIPLAYSINGADRFFVPPNVYVLGLMNTADRSIAMVDYALRRRFAFVNLEPGFDSPLFAEYLRGRAAPETLIQRVLRDMQALNEEISSDKINLGDGYCIGHSYFCGRSVVAKATLEWYREVIESEIAPLLREYWADQLEKANAWEKRLLSE